MLVPQISTREQTDAFFKSSPKLSHFRNEVVQDAQGNHRVAWDLVLYCPGREWIFVILDYKTFPYDNPYRHMPADTYLRVDEESPINAQCIRAKAGLTVPGISDYDRVLPELRFYAWARSLLKPGSVLDCSCGVGAGVNILLHRDDITRAVGVAQSHFAHIFCQMLVKDKRAEFARSIPNEIFDNVVCRGVLEDVSDPFAFVEDLKRRVQSQGRIILSVPVEQGSEASSDRAHTSKWNRVRFVRFCEDYFEKTEFFFQRCAGQGLLASGDIRAQTWGPRKDGWLIAVATGVKKALGKKIVIRRVGDVSEVLWVTPVVRRLCEKDPQNSVVVVTNHPEVFANNPYADLVIAPSYPGEVHINLDGEQDKKGSPHILESYRRTAGLDEVPLTPDIHRFDERAAFIDWARKRRKIIVCHTMKASLDRKLDESFWEALVERLKTRHLVLLAGNTEDYDLLVPGAISLVGPEMTLGWAGALLKKADLLVAPECSFLCDLAAATETTCVIIPAKRVTRWNRPPLRTFVYVSGEDLAGASRGVTPEMVSDVVEKVLNSTSSADGRGGSAFPKGAFPNNGGSV